MDIRQKFGVVFITHYKSWSVSLLIVQSEDSGTQLFCTDDLPIAKSATVVYTALITNRWRNIVGCTNMTGNWIIQKMKNPKRFLEVIPALSGRVLGMFSHDEPKMARRHTEVILPPDQQSATVLSLRLTPQETRLTVVALSCKVDDGDRGSHCNEQLGSCRTRRSSSVDRKPDMIPRRTSRVQNHDDTQPSGTNHGRYHGMIPYVGRSQHFGSRLMIDLMMMIARRSKWVSRDIGIKLLTVKSYGDERSSEVVRRRAKCLCQIIAEEM